MAWFERHWYSVTPLSFLLSPLSIVFHAAVALRRVCYRLGVLRVTKVSVPVVVIGNITVGGTGKTPLVLWLVGFLRSRGMQPGIVSRGYGGKTGAPRPVTAASDPAVCGDEAVMLSQCCNAPVWVGIDRAATARALLAAHPACNVIVSDDGLQHYGLARDVEIVVVDGGRGVGNGFMLPAGPLREPATRLASVDAIIVNVSQSAAVGLNTIAPAAFAMSLTGSEFYNLLNPERRAGPEQFRNRRVHAVAAIGNPQRFFEHLRRLGVNFTARPFPDHHMFTAADLAFVDADCIVMTEKDAVKCRRFAHENHWVLPVAAEVDAAFGELVLDKLGRGRHGS
ncbi:MAG: tetraacyldisaccharide 4'-kinase [Betaproteobacteria bacterium]|nr:tetraacyldisaccharide 4'-kinase [Betaproteobacteria bacterium]